MVDQCRLRPLVVALPASIKRAEVGGARTQPARVEGLVVAATVAGTAGQPLHRPLAVAAVVQPLRRWAVEWVHRSPRRSVT